MSNNFLKKQKYFPSVSFDNATYKFTLDHIEYLTKYLDVLELEMLNNPSKSCSELTKLILNSLQTDSKDDLMLQMFFISRGVDEFWKEHKKFNCIDDLYKCGDLYFGQEFLCDNLIRVIFNACLTQLEKENFPQDRLEKFSEYCKHLGETIENIFFNLATEILDSNACPTFEQIYKAFISCINDNVENM